MEMFESKVKKNKNKTKTQQFWKYFNTSEEDSNANKWHFCNSTVFTTPQVTFLLKVIWHHRI